MTENGKTLGRRGFLKKGTFCLLGSLFGLNALTISKAFAFGEPKKKPISQSHIAIIIDDIGVSFSRARLFLELNIPITFSILPWLSKSYDLAHEIHGKGHEIMLHQPMQPHNHHLEPGPGALYAGDGKAQITETMEKNIASLPHIVGVNNHMGSKFTECRNEMNDVLTVIRENDLFFVDSLTTNHSIAGEIAQRLHMVTTRRNIFLDNEREESAVLCQLNRLKNHAQKYGYAIGIGHPFPETAGAIGRFLQDLECQDLSFVHVSRVI